MIEISTLLDKLKVETGNPNTRNLAMTLTAKQGFSIGTPIGRMSPSASPNLLRGGLTPNTSPRMFAKKDAKIRAESPLNRIEKIRENCSSYLEMHSPTSD